MPQRRSHFPGATSNSTPLKQKRALSPPPSTSTAGSRRSKRIKSSPVEPAAKTTPKKSPYFEHATSESDDQSDDELDDSGYEDEDASAVSSPPESEASEESEGEAYATSEDEGQRKKKKPGRKAGSAKKKLVVVANGVKGAAAATNGGKQGTELWRPGIKVQGEGEVFIALPKARPAGSTPYTDSTIHPHTLLFLADLARNNERDWLKTHDADYRQSLKDWNTFVDALTPKLIEKDFTIPELPNKDLTFRIYRDIRFSPDPTPYKTHFSAAWSRTGRKGPYAGYYVQIKPKGCFVGAGVWHPEAEPLGKLRRSVDRHGDRLKGVLLDPALRKEFLGGVKADEKECVKKFVALNAENALKTKPRDYDANHPDIALLRLRNYTIGKKLKDEDVLGKSGLDRIVNLLGVLTPFVTHLNNVVMPDNEPDPTDDEDEDEDEDEDGGGESDGGSDIGSDVGEPNGGVEESEGSVSDDEAE